MPSCREVALAVIRADRYVNPSPKWSRGRTPLDERDGVLVISPQVYVFRLSYIHESASTLIQPPVVWHSSRTTGKIYNLYECLYQEQNHNEENGESYGTVGTETIYICWGVQ